MILQTKVVIAKRSSNNPISYASKNGTFRLLLFGKYWRAIRSLSNFKPFKILMEFYSILKQSRTLVANAIHKKRYTQEELVFQNDRWHCLDAHSSLSSVDKRNS